MVVELSIAEHIKQVKNKVRAINRAMTRESPSFSPGAGWPSWLMVGVSTRSMVSAERPQLWLTRWISKRRRLILRPMRLR